MNNNLIESDISAKPTTERLLEELKHETGMARRQVLLKALWKLEQRIAQSSTKSTVSRDQVPDVLGDSPAASLDARETVTVIMNEQHVLPTQNDSFAIEKFSLAS